MTVTTVNEGLLSLLWKYDMLFSYDPSSRMWNLGGPRNDLQGNRMRREREPEPWQTVEVPASSLQDAEDQALQSLRRLDEYGLDRLR